MSRRPIVINNMQIDYDKLADAIVKAQRKAKELEEQNECSNMQIDYNSITDAIVEANNRVNNTNQTEINGEKLGFWKAVLKFFASTWYIIIGKKSSNNDLITAPFKVVIKFFYNIISIIIPTSLVVLLSKNGFSWAIIAKWQGLGFIINSACVALLILSIVLFILLAILFRGVANDIEYEKDKSVVLSVFSCTVSMISIIIAIIALYRA